MLQTVFRSRWNLAVVAFATALVVNAVPSASALSVPTVAASALETINFYRTSSGLGIVESNAASASGIANHLAYLSNTNPQLRLGPFASVHTENPASSWYTVSGAAAAVASNIGPGPTARSAIDNWMAAPLHAIGILRPGLNSVYFGMDAKQAMLNILDGLNNEAVTTSPILFPGDGATTYLTSYSSELPDPRDGCANAAAAYKGLPIIAMLPTTPPAGVSAELLRSDGIISAGPDLCVQTAASYQGATSPYADKGRTILAAANAVILIPKQPLGLGNHQVTLRLPGQTPIVWSFNVIDDMSPNRVVPHPVGKLHVSGAGVGGDAALVNLTMTEGNAPGYVTADKCSRLVAGPQSQSNGNFAPGQTVANLAVVPVDADGGMCVYNSSATHMVVDRQGVFSSKGALAFTPSIPTRILDTRNGPRPPAGSVQRVRTAAAPGTQAGLVNLTMTQGESSGYVTADKCSRLMPGPQSQSNGNFGFNQAVANLSVVPLDTDGSFCVYSSAAVHLVVDIQATLSTSGLLALTMATPQRVGDTRSGTRPAAASITRVSTGAAPGAQSVLVNLTMTDAVTGGYVTADKCSRLRAGPQAQSNANFAPGQTMANLAVVTVDPDGSFCIFASAPVHLVADIQGAFATNGALRFTPSIPTRISDTRVP